MTRINLVDPSTLTPLHLLAEYRELPRTFGLIKKWQLNPTPLPPKFTMGKGHVRFFYNKAHWLVIRQKLLIEELQYRGYQPKHTRPYQLLEGIDQDLQVMWIPSEEDIAVSRQRIEAKLAASASK